MNANFKRDLEVAYKIVQWSPTERQLLSIAQYIHNNPKNIGQVGAYICEICDDVLLEAFEGVDNSDLNYLIALATKTLKEAK